MPTLDVAASTVALAAVLVAHAITPAVHTSLASSASASVVQNFAGTAAPSWFEAGSLSFELVKGLPALIVTLVIGFFAAYIAWRQLQVSAEQRRVAHAKLNLDLFERRLKIFQATEQFLINSLPGAPPDQTDFVDQFSEACFLFESEVEAYMNRALHNRREAHMIHLRAKANKDMVRPEDIARDNELMKWFSDEHNGGCRLVFAPYLDFGEWR